ncbi:MAG: hypothetical protein ACPGQL_04240 [Thermoplasmatota archaeon]
MSATATAVSLFPPTSERVLEALDASSTPMSPLELQEATGLKRRTMYLALQSLNELRAVRVGVSLRDARRRKYTLAERLRDGRWRDGVDRLDC